MKALLINGSRPVADRYDLQVDNSINYQGWGLANLPTSIPTNLNSATASMLMFDQSPTNALATGQKRTYTVTVDPSAADSPLRVTLAWTDPPGNPVASTKLVNDLDLVVTNRDTGDIFFGNDILAGSDFNLPWDTNCAQSRLRQQRRECLPIAPSCWNLRHRCYRQARQCQRRYRAHRTTSPRITPW